jgi:hypothetical protein
MILGDAEVLTQKKTPKHLSVSDLVMMPPREREIRSVPAVCRVDARYRVRLIINFKSRHEILANICTLKRNREIVIKPRLKKAVVSVNVYTYEMFIHVSEGLQYLWEKLYNVTRHVKLDEHLGKLFEFVRRAQNGPLVPLDVNLSKHFSAIGVTVFSNLVIYGIEVVSLFIGDTLFEKMYIIWFVRYAWYSVIVDPTIFFVLGVIRNLKFDIVIRTVTV